MWLAGTFLSAIGLAMTLVALAWMFLTSLASEHEANFLARGDNPNLLGSDPVAAREIRERNAPTITWVRSKATPWAFAGVGLFLLGLFMSA